MEQHFVARTRFARVDAAKEAMDADACVDEALELAKVIVHREAQALRHLADTLEQSPAAQREFRRALQLALQYTSRVPGHPGGKMIVVGVGKSGTWTH